MCSKFLIGFQLGPKTHEFCCSVHTLICSNIKHVSVLLAGKVSSGAVCAVTGCCKRLNQHAKECAGLAETSSALLYYAVRVSAVGREPAGGLSWYQNPRLEPSAVNEYLDLNVLSSMLSRSPQKTLVKPAAVHQSLDARLLTEDASPPLGIA